MTIAAAYLTSEGVVLGADSAAAISNPAGQVVQLLNHAQKVLEAGQKSRIGYCCWRAGSIGKISRRATAARLGDLPNFGAFTVQEAANALSALIVATRSAEQVSNFLGCFIGGWNLGTHDPQCFELVFEQGQNGPAGLLIASRPMPRRQDGARATDGSCACSCTTAANRSKLPMVTSS